MFHINVRGQLPAAQSAVRRMGAGGRVVLNLAVELRRGGITINAIAPGGGTTDISASAEAGHFPGADPAAITEAPAAVAFLVPEDASYGIGRTLVVDGGLR